MSALPPLRPIVLARCSIYQKASFHIMPPAVSSQFAQPFVRHVSSSTHVARHTGRASSAIPVRRCRLLNAAAVSHLGNGTRLYATSGPTSPSAPPDTPGSTPSSAPQAPPSTAATDTAKVAAATAAPTLPKRMEAIDPREKPRRDGASLSGPSPGTTDASLDAALRKAEGMADDDDATAATQPDEYEEEYEEDEEDAAVDDDEATPAHGDVHFVTDQQRQLQFEKRLKQVQRVMGLQEVLSKEGLQKSLNFTNVSTTSGVHWQDISANAALRDRPGFMKQPEGFFAHTVLESVFGSSLAPELSAFVMDGNPLPHVIVGKDWWGLTLRVSLEGAAAVQVSSLVDVPDDSTLRDSDIARVRSLESFYGPASFSTATEDEVDSLANQLFGAGAANTGTRIDGTEVIYDEETDTYITKGPPRPSFVTRLRRLFPAHGHSRRARHKDASQKRRPRARPKSSKSTLQHFSSKLTIVVLRETHPIESVMSPQSLDHTTTTPTPEEEEEQLWEKNEEEREARQRPLVMYDPNNPTASTLSAAEHKFADRSSSTAEDQTEAPEPPRAVSTRFRVMSVHRYPIPFLDAAFANWPALATSKLVAPLGVPAVDTIDDVVRLMIRGAVASFQEDAYRATRQMETIENRIYAADANVGAHRANVASIMAHLHVMSRRARAQEMILRDTQMAAVRLRALRPGDQTTRDVQDRAFMDRCISLATHVEEHTESLLFLQFQVVSNDMADNLRTLTIFSTFFIPLNFILDVFNMRFDGLLAWCEQDTSILVFLSILLVATLGMARFVRRHLQS